MVNISQPDIESLN